MDDRAPRETMRFGTEAALALETAFDGGRINSDSGLVWLSMMDRQMDLCEAISECVPEWRKRCGRHSTLSLVRQRVFQIASGYEDQNDSDTLREDPLLKAACGSLPESGRDLASQPTICRLENAATRRACHRMAEVLFELYLSERGNDGAPKKILLDFDCTDDPPTATKKAPTTTATTNSTCTIPSSSSMARRGTSSRRCFGRETPTPRTPRSPCSSASFPV